VSRPDDRGGLLVVISSPSVGTDRALLWCCFTPVCGRVQGA